MIDVVRRVTETVFRPGTRTEPLTVLVLGDPSARMCTALIADGHRVACCPDLQRQDESRHTKIAAATVEELLEVDGRWNVVVALAGFQRMQEVHTSATLTRMVKWLSQRCDLFIVEAPRLPLAPDLNDLGPYTVFPRLGSFLFVSELDDPPDTAQTSTRPVLICSDQGLLLFGTWIPSERFRPLFDPANISEKRVRTYLMDDRVLKVELASEGYFDRCEALLEARFLSSTSEHERQQLNLPTVSVVHAGRSTNVVIRDYVFGASLSPGKCTTNPSLVAAVLRAASRWAELGLFHNDLRPWNFLVEGDQATLIDYSGVSNTDTDCQGIPQILALAGTIASLKSFDLPWGEEYLPALLALVSEIGLEQHWTFEQMMGDDLQTSPWLSLPHVVDHMIQSLATSTTFDAGETVLMVVDTLMSAHVTRTDDEHE